MRACYCSLVNPYSCKLKDACAAAPQELECVLIQLPHRCLDLAGCVGHSLAEASDFHPTETLVGWLLALAVTALIVYRHVPKVSM